MFRNKNINKSLAFRLTIGLTLIIATLLTLLVLINLYSFKIVRKNIVDSSKSALTINILNAENNLKAITQGLDEFTYYYINDISGYQNKNELDRYLSSMQLKDLLAAKIASNKNIDCMFISQQSSGLFLAQLSKRITGLENVNLIKNLTEGQTFENDSSTEKWRIYIINDSNYFIQTYKLSDIVIGVLVRTDTLMGDVQRTLPSNQINYALTDDKGKVLYLSSSSLPFKDLKFIANENEAVFDYNGRYMLINQNLNLCNVKLSCIQENKNVFSALELIQWVIIIFVFISIILIALSVCYLFKAFITPVRGLLSATNQVEKGNWEYRLPTNQLSLEFSTLFSSFNSMIKEIKTLKINSYEEKIERQKAELRYLQLQIKPHFFLNAISTISSLSLQSKNEEICKYIDALSNHFRYKFKGGLTKVSLKQEIYHVKNYIRMQQIKYPNNIFYMIETVPELDEASVPNFLIENFTENIFKHAFTHGKMLSIFLKTEFYLKDNVHFIKIIIEDNGDGFPKDILELYNQPVNHNSCEEKIGIANIKKTLALIYGRDDLLILSNTDPSGAKVQILIPIEEKETNS